MASRKDGTPEGGGPPGPDNIILVLLETVGKRRIRRERRFSAIRFQQNRNTIINLMKINVDTSTGGPMFRIAGGKI
jgi:hypothetical protein